MANTFRLALALCGLTIGLAACNVLEPQPKPAEADAAVAPAPAQSPAAPVGTEAAPPAPESSETAIAAPTRLADPFRRADASFSRFALNSSGVRPQAIGRLANGEICDDEMIECAWEDTNGVQHTFGGKVLAIKSIKLEAGDRRAIGALDIGTARQPPEVLKRVRAFLPEVAIKCVKASDSGEGGRSACQGSFRNGGWLKLLFSAETGQLEEARIDAFQIN